MSDTKKRGVVLSDSHFLGGSWLPCTKTRLPDDCMRGLLDHADLAVLNGDIFDPHFSGLQVDEWLEKASAITERWLKNYPQCEFHYVLGNHDGYLPWLERLEEIAREFPHRLHIHTDEYRLGNALFLHGDIANRTDHVEQRSIRSRKRMRQGLKADINKYPHTMEPKGDHETRIDLLAAALKPETLTGVEHLFTGHFHFPAINASLPGYPDIFYHNTGSPRGAASFTPLFFDIEEDQHVSHVRAALPLEIVPNVTARAM